MWRILRKRVTAGAMAAMLMLVNVVMPVQPVFADDGASNSGTEATLEPDTNTEGVVNAVESATTVEAKTVELDYKHKETLCHATNAAINPYVVITVDYHSFTKKGHDIHDGPIADSVAEAQRLKSQKIDWGDIIPAVPEWGYGGKNVPAGQSILDNECQVPDGESEGIELPDVKPVDDCGLNNAYWDVDALNAQGFSHVTFKLNSKDKLVAVADKGYVFEINGKRSYNYGFAQETNVTFCEATSEKPRFVDLCGTTNDYYIVEETENVAYYNGEELLVAGQKYYVTDTSEVTVTAKATDDDYEIVNDVEYSNQFTNKACSAEVKLETNAWCTDVVDTKVKVVLTNETESWQAYEVVVSNDEGELVSRVVVVPAGETKNLKNTFEGDGEFTISVYSYNNETRGELLDEQTVMTECVDTFTPEIYKKNQDGAILSTGTFDVKVCQEYGEFARVLMDEEDNCTMYEDVMFGTDGSWFANNVEYKHNVPTTVTITETEAPVGCELSITPWVFTWNYLNMDVNAFNAFLAQREGSWEMTSGVGSVDGQVFNLTNNCDQPGRGEYTPTPSTPSTPSTPVETLAETGDSENAIIGVAAGMLLASIGLAISPRFRRGEA